MMKNLFTAGAAALLLGVSATAQASDSSWTDDAVIVTASNTAANQLLVYSPTGTLLKSIHTQGQGGVAGNAGGVAASRDRVAVVNFGSANVSIFARDDDGRLFHLEKVVQALGSPVSVAFGEDHLYILTTARIESHPIGPRGVGSAADGATQLLHGDGTAAQVGVMDGQLIIAEKSNAIETVNLDRNGAVRGAAVAVANLPANVDTPFGLAARGNQAYVTIAHADEISLVRNGKVLAVTSSVTQHAPCWVALDGPFLFSANSPSKSVSRYAVYGQQIVQDAAVAATFNGNPTDIAYRAGLAAVIDANGTVSHVSIFNVDQATWRCAAWPR
jgi:6-phosphogluconolactonase (cycloisomerase 2 family)